MAFAPGQGDPGSTRPPCHRTSELGRLDNSGHPSERLSLGPNRLRSFAEGVETFPLALALGTRRPRGMCLLTFPGPLFMGVPASLPLSGCAGAAVGLDPLPARTVVICRACVRARRAIRGSQQQRQSCG